MIKKPKQTRLSARNIILKLGIFAVCSCIFAGCGVGSGTSKQCKIIKAAQTGLKNLESSHMTILSKMESPQRTDRMSTEFVYKMNAKGTMEYCQTQMDETNKMTFCEINEAEKSEQWLLGKGWCSVDPVAYSKENPHQYVGLLTNPMDEQVIEKITSKDYDTNKKYTAILDAKKLNAAHYKDTAMEVKAQEISFLLSSKGELICYMDTATILDKDTAIETVYSLEIQISEHNAITEIAKPELRADAVAEAEKNANAAINEGDEGK